jgi:hypothetical protein
MIKHGAADFLTAIRQRLYTGQQPNRRTVLPDGSEFVRWRWNFGGRS